MRVTTAGSDSPRLATGSNERERDKVTRDERGYVVTVPVSLVGLVAMWSAAVGLIGWTSVGGPEHAGQFGLLASAAAAAWTVIYGLAAHQDREHEMLRHAFDLGRESTGSVRNLVDR